MKRLLTLCLTFFLVTGMFAQKSDSASGSQKNKIELHDWIFIGWNFSGDVFGWGFHNEITASVINKFDIGIGAGIEITQLKSIYSVSRIPVYLVHNFHFYKNLYLTFRPSFFIPYGVHFYNDDYKTAQSPLFYGNSLGRTVHDPDELLKTGIGMAIGMIWNFNDEITLQLLYQNQPSCLYEPYSGRLDFFSARFGVILK